MKDIKPLINALRIEHNELCQKITANEFALRTIDFDEKEKELLESQTINMKWYAERLRDRAAYAKKKSKQEAEK